MEGKIRIPNACSENFKRFSATPNGGFCQKCRKEVFDFREMDGPSILEFLSNNPSNSCGIFSPSQISTYKSLPKKAEFPRFWALGLLGITGLSSPMFAKAIVSPSIEQSQWSDQTIIPEKPFSPVKRTIKGKVIMYYFNDKESVPGATVILKGVPNISTSTDAEGYFELEVPDSVTSEKISILISFVGYQIREVSVYRTQLPVQLGEIKLYEDNFVMGEIIYIKPNLWQRVKGIFKSKSPQSCTNSSHKHK
jgi:hypothetical protein